MGGCAARGGGWTWDDRAAPGIRGGRAWHASPRTAPTRKPAYGADVTAIGVIVAVLADSATAGKALELVSGGTPIAGLLKTE
ncbi:hypothetical protein [Nonomuraea jiangxiensis]|uniref:Uncharacterized protein n=1 Tax=Nonomuraea jiangxiensis TaxID=633440 RepID=A0A1G8K8V0_9ACTN|nr:hypothetical protein [Nonomuraea jiangxiensis]SDI39888.1 hypothetical protein SAMN05421869_105320 [Nonomuraea jiangxiensis]